MDIGAIVDFQSLTEKIAVLVSKFVNHTTTNKVFFQ